MATSLYDLSVPPFLQTLRAVSGFLGRAAEHCAATGGNPDALVEARLIADMAPLHFQIEALTHHAVYAVDAVLRGVFEPPPLRGAIPFAELRAMVDEAEAALQAFDRAAVDACAGKVLDLQIGPRRLAFNAEEFILSFSLPNFHFHAVTAYDILRANGVPIGKRDYEGVLRTR